MNFTPGPRQLLRRIAKGYLRSFSGFGFCAQIQAGKNTLALSDFMWRAGMLINSRLICQSATASRCSQIASICQLLANAIGSTKRQSAAVKSRSDRS
jgi:hypothetical protein